MNEKRRRIVKWRRRNMKTREITSGDEWKMRERGRKRKGGKWC